MQQDEVHTVLNILELEDANTLAATNTHKVKQNFAFHTEGDEDVAYQDVQKLHVIESFVQLMEAEEDVMR